MVHHLTPQATLWEGYAAAAQDVVFRDIAPEVVDLASREEPLQLSEDVADDRTTAALPPRQVEDLASCIWCRHPNAFPSRPAHARVASWRQHSLVIHHSSDPDQAVVVADRQASTCGRIHIPRKRWPPG